MADYTLSVPNWKEKVYDDNFPDWSFLDQVLEDEGLEAYEMTFVDNEIYLSTTLKELVLDGSAWVIKEGGKVITVEVS